MGKWELVNFYSFYADCSGRPAAATHSAPRAALQEMDQINSGKSIGPVNPEDFMAMTVTFESE